MSAAHRWIIRRRVGGCHVSMTDAAVRDAARGWAARWGLPPARVVRVALAEHRANRKLWAAVVGGQP